MKTEKDEDKLLLFEISNTHSYIHKTSYDGRINKVEISKHIKTPQRGESRLCKTPQVHFPQVFTPQEEFRLPFSKAKFLVRHSPSQKI